jgi:hypothetical protein
VGIVTYRSHSFNMAFDIAEFWILAFDVFATLIDWKQVLPNGFLLFSNAFR